MNSVLELRMNNREGILERILGCLRQRGFLLCALQMERSADAAHLIVKVTVESHRPIEGACRQLTKLVDVQSVKLEHAEAKSGEGYVYNEQSNQRAACLPV